MTIYKGIKTLKYDLSEDALVSDEVRGLRVVKVDEELLKSILVKSETMKDNYRVFDWGKDLVRNRGMNLSYSILNHHLRNQPDMSGNIPPEMTYRLFKEVVYEFEDEWEFNDNQLMEYLSRIYDEIYIK